MKYRIPPFLFFALLMVSCSFDTKDENRYYSDAFTCDEQQECFELIDSVLFSDNSGIDQLKWNALSRADTVISFHDYSSLQENATILVSDYFKADSAGTYLLRLGSDDGFRLLVNGVEVQRRITGRSVKPNSDWMLVDLKKGVNELLFQVNQKDGGWGLYYTIDNSADLNTLIQSKLYEIYKDLPESCIIETGDSTLPLKIDPRSNLDIFHSVIFSWINPQLGELLSDTTFPASQLPTEIPIPNNTSFPLVLKYTIIGEDKQIAYHEFIPIFDESSTKKYVGLTSQKMGTESGNPWETGLHALFAEELGLDKNQEYSTRMKSEFLWDAMHQSGLLDFAIGGPRTKLFNGALSREYVPYRLLNKTTPKMSNVLGLHVEFSDSVHHYHESYAGSSHALMTSWNSYSQYYNIRLLFPFILEQNEALNTHATIQKYMNQKADTFNVVAWSKSVPMLFETMEQSALPIKQVATISPWLIDSPTESFLIARNISQKNPNVEFFIWHGKDDTDVPSYIVNDWVETFRRQGFTAKLNLVPHSTHWNYWIEPEDFFYKQLN